MFPVQQSASLPDTFFAFDANGDGVTGKVDGDWTKRISKNGGAFAAMTVTISEMENGWYSLTLSTSHTDTLGVLSLSFVATGVKRVNMKYRVTVRTLDELAFPTVAGRSLDVTATGAAGIDWGNLENPSTAQNLSATNIDVDQIVASVSGAVGSVTAGVTLAASAIQAIWDALTSALTTAGSIGKLLVDNINATISSRASQTSVDTIDDFIDTEVAAIKAKTDNLPASPAATGDAMTLTAGERNAVADAHLDRADAIEVGLTPRQAHRLEASASAGKLAGAATTSVTIRNAVADSKTRITATVDADGNRSAVTTDVT